MCCTTKAVLPSLFLFLFFFQLQYIKTCHSHWDCSQKDSMGETASVLPPFPLHSCLTLQHQSWHAQPSGIPVDGCQLPNKPWAPRWAPHFLSEAICSKRLAGTPQEGEAARRYLPSVQATKSKLLLSP